MVTKDNLIKYVKTKIMNEIIDDVERIIDGVSSINHGIYEDEKSLYTVNEIENLRSNLEDIECSILNLASNRKVTFDYEIGDEIEVVGITILESENLETMFKIITICLNNIDKKAYENDLFRRKMKYFINDFLHEFKYLMEEVNLVWEEIKEE